MSFGTNLAEMRKKHGLSQEELGEKLGVSRQTIYTWESDTSSPSMDKLILIADFFGCTVDSLIRGEAEAVTEAQSFCGNKLKITKFIKGFAFKIAFATFLVLTGISAMIMLEPFVGDYALAAFFVPLIAAVAIYIYAGISHSAFFTRSENKNYKSLFTPEEKSAELRRFGIILAIAVGAILIGVLQFCLMGVNDYENAALALFLFITAISVFFIIYNAIPLSKYEENAGENMSDEDRRRLALSEKINAVLWLVTVAAYLLMGFLVNLWHPGWIIFIVASFASGIIEIICGVKKE